MSKNIPNRIPGTRIAIIVDKEGVKLYGNRSAFRSLSEWLSWIAAAKESEHYECHVVMSLEDEEVIFHGKSPSNITIVCDKTISEFFEKRSENSTGFELTFMAVEEKDLDELEEYQSSGLLPDEWYSK